MDEDLTIAQLTPSEQMLHKLHLKQQAATAVTKADNDARLRRALLRQHQAQQHIFHTGQEVFYWRDAPGGAGPKIRWKGPAIITMVEPGRAGPTTNNYWLVHGTTLLRASAEHLRPNTPHTTTTDDPTTTTTHKAKQALEAVRNRSTTLYYDLNKSNKRKREEVVTEDEEEDAIEQEAPPPDPDGDQPMAIVDAADHWDVSEDGITWIRIHVQPRRELFVPTEDPNVPCLTFRNDRLTTIRRSPPHSQRFVMQDDWTEETAGREMPYNWTGTTTFTVRSNHNSTHTTTTPPTTTSNFPTVLNTPTTEDMTIETDHEPNHSADLPAIPPTPTDSTGTTEPQHEPDPPTTAATLPAANTPAIPAHQQQLYQPRQPGETFEQLRARVDRQETLSLYQPHHGMVTYGPNRETFAREERPHNTSTPYHRATQPEEKDITEQTYHTYDNIDLLSDSNQSLPPGWHIISDGTIELGDTQDEWQLKKGWLIRKHYLARTSKYEPDEATCPIPLAYLGKDRVTKYPAYTSHDRWRNKRDTTHQQQQEEAQPWTGSTCFKILQASRQQAATCFYTASNGHSTYIEPSSTNTSKNKRQPQTKAKAKARKEQLSEKNMTLEDRLSFAEAKKAELASFFQNDVWEIDDQSSAPEGRVLKAHFILKWSKHADGTPRAKARLITQGFRDPDALAGVLTTESPTLSRLARNYILVIAAMNGWLTFSADISTAFLQGKEHEASRTLWIRLSNEANRMLGLPSDGSKLLRLKKPMYGLCDAPRAWFLEAKERLISLGAQQHPLDACLYLLYDHKAPYEQWTTTTDSKGNQHTSPPLCAIFGLHVDDIIGCANINNSTYQHFKTQLQERFNFRTWEEGVSFEYCGAQINKISPNHYTLEHTKYLSKQKPISFTDDNKDRPVTEKERTNLRATIGALQWPSGQSSPHLQAMISQLAGQVTTATTNTLKEANKILRFAKQHSDASLQFQKLGERADVTFTAYCDAAFACRHDNTSQGGYLILMTHKSIKDGAAVPYCLVDWRSWKLPRVARSSLSAEAQAASETADAMMYNITFWQLIWHPTLAIDDMTACQLPHKPCIVTDAKALYDLLTKQELQPNSGADKRTSVELLVTQDKLKCMQAETKWVSSELQYADGMTKASAAALLAQRLRTHYTSVKPDDQFIAAKKKSAADRKKSAEQFALRKPQRAMQALLATAYLVMQSDSQSLSSDQLTQLPPHDPDQLTYFDLTFIILITFAVIIILHLLLRLSYATFRRMTSPLSMTSTNEVETQTTREDPDLQQQLERVQRQLQHLEQQYQQEHHRSQRREEHLNLFKRKYATELEKNKEIHLRTKEARDTMAADVLSRQTKFNQVVDRHVAAGREKAANRPVHFAPHGTVWHADPQCEALTRPNTTKFSRRPCKVCAHTLAPRIPDGEVREVLARCFRDQSLSRASTD